MYKTYQEVQGEYSDLIKAGADPKSIDLGLLSRNRGPSWEFYYALSCTLSPSSADAERAFSSLSRLRSRFRRRLHNHIPSLTRISFSKHTHVLDDELLDEIILAWDRTVHRRNRRSGLAKKRRKKQHRLNMDGTGMWEME